VTSIPTALETTVRKSLIVPVLAAASLAAGCGATAYGANANAHASAPAAHAAAARAASVKITNFAFKPGTIHVKPGQTIRFVNDDSVTHTVTATKGAKFDSGNLKPGKSFTVKAGKAGTIHYVCLIHPDMKGTIKVG
jgi:plastocyanin